MEEQIIILSFIRKRLLFTLLRTILESLRGIEALKGHLSSVHGSRNRPGSRRRGWGFSPGHGQFWPELCNTFYREYETHFVFIFFIINNSGQSQNGQIPVPAKIGSSRPRPGQKPNSGRLLHGMTLTSILT